MTEFDLERFVAAQNEMGGLYAQALSEIKAGRKRLHWIWFIFPQMRGLGHSRKSEFYGIASLAVMQATSYTASGVPVQGLASVADRHMHTGKPWQNLGGLAWYDNCARWYDPVTMRFTTPDPLAEKYPGISPWAYCANNPVNCLDSNGLNYYSIDENGYFHLIETNDDITDRIFSSISDEYIDVSKQFFTSQITKEVTSESSYGKENVTISTYSSKNLRIIYDFLKDNTGIEWSYVKIQNDRSVEYLGTTHIDGIDISQDYITKQYVAENGQVIELRHVHPNGFLVVSPGDVEVAKTIQLKSPNAKFYIDIPFSKQTKQYDSRSEPGLLQEIIIYPQAK